MNHSICLNTNKYTFYKHHKGGKIFNCMKSQTKQNLFFSWT